MKYAALLRGVNVGGNKLVKMEQLRALCESLNLRGARTLLQSGNVVFRSEEKNRERLARRIEGGIKKKFWFEARVVVRSSADLRRVIQKNPFTIGKSRNPSLLQIMFLDARPEACAFADLRSSHKGPEEMHLAGEELYIYYLNGAGKSKLTNDYIQRKLQVTGTARNWNTVEKLFQLAEGLIV